MTDDDRSVSTLFDSIAYRLGYEKVNAALPVSVSPLVLWAAIFVVFDVVVLQAYKQFQGYTATFVDNPAWLIQPLFALVGAKAVTYLHARYERALDHIDLEVRTTNPGRFERLSPTWLRVALYAIALSYNYWNVFFNVGVETILQIGGVAELVGSAVVAPIGYGIIYAEFLATYIGIMILLPRKIRQTDFKLNFLDPEGLGGLRPIGELAKTTYYVIVAGLIGYLGFTYGPFILGELVQTQYPRPGDVINIAFTALWLLTVATMAYGLSQLHWFMKRKKREELTRLDREARELVEDPFEPKDLEITDQDEFDDIRQRMDYVNSTKEYPTTFTMWSQILISLLLPKAIQVLLLAG